MVMAKKKWVAMVDYSQAEELTSAELCSICHMTPDMMGYLVEYGIVYPEKKIADQWVFDMEDVPRIKMALRLLHDLEVNWAGVAIVLDLLDKMRELQARADLLEKHILR
jgi:chaperone modulatory protein CbpM